MNDITTRAAALSFALITTLSILSGIFTLAAHEDAGLQLARQQAGTQNTAVVTTAAPRG